MKNINKINKPIAKLIKKKKRAPKNGGGGREVTTDNTTKIKVLKTTITIICQQIKKPRKKTDKLLETHKLPRLNQEDEKI